MPYSFMTLIKDWNPSGVLNYIVLILQQNEFSVP